MSDYNKANEDYKKAEIDGDDKAMEEAGKRANQAAENNGKSREEELKASSEYYALLGAQTGMHFAQMLAEGKGFWKSMAIVMIDALQAMVPAWALSIFGTDAASPTGVFSFFASSAAKVALFSGLVTGLLQTAKAAIGRKSGEVDIKGPEQKRATTFRD